MKTSFRSILALFTETVGVPRSLTQRLMAIIAIFFTLPSLAFGPPSLIDSDAGKLPIFPHQLKQFIVPPPPRLTAKSAVIMDFDTGRVVYEKNAHMRAANASTTKMMTAIVAMEQGRLTDKVTIEWKHLVGYASMGLWVGDVLTVEDLMWGMLLPSANEAAEAIADHIGGGSTENFVKMMNDKAVELGLQDTQFRNPHGLDEDGHYSSAYDLAVIARKALQYPLVNRMAATRQMTVYGNRAFSLYNSNSLLQMQDLSPGVDGFKTGYTGDAGNCLVATTTRNGHRLITVVMGSDARNPDSIALIDYGFDNFVWQPLPAPAASTTVDDAGTTRSFEIAGKKEVLTRPWEKGWLSFGLTIDRLSTPDRRSTIMGYVDYSIAGNKVAQYPLKVKE